MISRSILLRRASTLSLRMKSTNVKKEENTFEKELKAKIELHGPMNLSQFMLEVLSNPNKGYYTSKENVLGASGDFITAPEISQMFGECIAIWIIHEWRKMGSVKPLNIIEFGPGQGTLMQDILRTFQKLIPTELKDISIHLVETSPILTKIQEARLCGYFHNNTERIDENIVHRAISKQGLTVNWYTRVSDVPKGFSFFVANEFFDALPIHQFVKNPNTKIWEEVLVDIKENNLVFVKSRGRTLANQYIQNDPLFETLEVAEISPKSGVIMETLSERIVEFGGSALIIDYGYSKVDKNINRDTFRAFKNHKVHNPLQDIGQADLTADVNFDYLKQKTGLHTTTYGPVSQRQFLKQLGIEVRCNLLKESNPKIANDLSKSLELLIGPDQMGERFKFFCLFPKTMEPIHSEYPPAGFHEN